MAAEVWTDDSSGMGGEEAEPGAEILSLWGNGARKEGGGW